MKKNILITDDEPGHRLMLRAVLGEAGWSVSEAGSGEEALALLRSDSDLPDVVLLDMRMPGMDGMETLREMRALSEALPVVMLTAFGSVGSAVEAMKRGAFDYLTKPADNEEVLAVVKKAYDYGRLLGENRELKNRLSEHGAAERLIGETPAMRRLKDLMAQVGPTEATVLVLGESGTGKELVAEGVHQASARRDKALIKVNCAALPGDLLESELFGYVKGAFTGAVKDKPGRFKLADGGTLFLDEVGEIPMALQAKLLRALQDGVVEPLGSVRPVATDARIIAATNRNLAEEVREGRFREDLYYRLNVLEIAIPPLRERLDDLPLLATRLLVKLGDKNRKTVRGVSPEFLEKLQVYAWPGNVRELENVLERALILSRSDTLGPDLLPPHILSAEAAGPAVGTIGTAGAQQASKGAGEAPLSFDEAEKLAIVRALEANGGHRERTADALGVSRRTLQYKLKKYGLTRR